MHNTLPPLHPITLFCAALPFTTLFCTPPDRNRDGFIDLTELLVAVKGKMNPKRKALVQKAFDILDTDK